MLQIKFIIQISLMALIWSFNVAADSVVAKNRDGSFDTAKMCTAAIIGNPRPDMQVKTYIHSMGTSLNERKLGVSEALGIDEYFLRQHGVSADILSYLRTTAAKSQIVIDEAEKQKFTAQVMNPNFSTSDVHEGSVDILGTAACAKFHDRFCNEVVKLSFGIMHPVYFYSDNVSEETFNTFSNKLIPDVKNYAKVEMGIVSMLEVWQAAGLDSNMIIGSSRLALKILDRVSAGGGAALQGADLYTDGLNAFRSLNLGEAETKRLTLTLLGLYGTRGAAIATSLLWATDSNLPFFQSMLIIASAISYLDGLSWQSGKSYSLPQTTSFFCDETRAYHFWLPAYLAYTLRKEGHGKNRAGKNLDAISIFDGLHVLNTLYKLKSSVSTQRLRERPGSADVLSSFAVETDKDLILNDAGALWALSEANHAKPIDMTAALNTIFTGAAHNKGNFLQTIIDFDGWSKGYLQPWRTVLAR